MNRVQYAERDARLAIPSVRPFVKFGIMSKRFNILSKFSYHPIVPSVV